MQIADRLYGCFEVEGVLADLIRSAPVQRLKWIHQGGAGYLVKPEWNVTRYEHSVGVMLLIRRLGGSLEEQIAGLLHDVGHTAFSHVVDYVYGEGKENLHERWHRRIWQESEIYAILRKHGFHPESILSGNWTLLEKPLPDLSADRIDYTLRDRVRYGGLSLSEVERFLGDLSVGPEGIGVSSTKMAEWFVDRYVEEVIDFFLDPLNAYAQLTLAEAIRRSLDIGLLRFDDWFLDDGQVIQKMRTGGDEHVSALLDRLREGIRVEEAEQAAGLHFRSKPRMVDPLIYRSDPPGAAVRASAVSERVREKIEYARRRSLQGVYIKVAE
jgi:uncharacterized protein